MVAEEEKFAARLGKGYDSCRLNAAYGSVSWISFEDPVVSLSEKVNVRFQEPRTSGDEKLSFENR